MIKAELMALLTLLIRHFSDRRFCSESKKHIKRLEPVFMYIEENFFDKISLDYCAKIVSLSPQYFSAYFKKVCGISFIDYVVSVRISHCAAKLEKNNISVTQAALECGFNNMGNFNCMFKKYMGCTPTQYMHRK